MLIVLGYLIPRLRLSVVQVFRIYCSWASLSVPKWSSGCKFCHSADVDRIIKPQILSPALLWAGHSTSHVLSVHQPCPEHQDVGSCDPPGSQLCAGARRDVPVPVRVSKLCPWPAGELGPFLQKVLCGGFGRGCCWLCRAAWFCPLALRWRPALLICSSTTQKKASRKPPFSPIPFFPGCAQEKTCVGQAS